MPYNCIFEDCKTPDEMFIKADELMVHVMKEHSHRYWVCQYCPHDDTEKEPEIFKTLNDWHSHMETRHTDIIPAEQIISFVMLSEKKMVPPMGCPLCSHESNRPTHMIDDHILRHVHEFSLRSLPWGTRAARKYEHESSASATAQVKTIAQADAAKAVDNEDEDDETKGLEHLEKEEPENVVEMLAEILSLQSVIVGRAERKNYSATFNQLSDLCVDEQARLGGTKTSAYQKSIYITTIRKLRDFMKLFEADIGRYQKRLGHYLTSDMINEIANNFIDEIRAARDTLSPSQPLVSIPIPRNPSFTGHQKILEDLDRMLPTHEYVNGSKVVLLQGEEGVGKTEIALEFAYRTAAGQYYGPVLWMKASSQQGPAMILKATDSTKRADDMVQASEAFEHMISRLSRSPHGRWLLVIDELTKEIAEDLRAGITQMKAVESTGCVLITTRDLDINAFLETDDNSNRTQEVQKNPTKLISITAMSVDPAIKLVRDLLFNDKHVTTEELALIEQLVRECHYKPKAIKDAASTVKRTRLSLANLRSLPNAVDAPFNSYNRQNEYMCLPDTHVELLQEIYNWADGHDERCIFWLNGLAGSGKSTIARTVAHRFFETKQLAASFFFAKGGGDVGHAGKFVTSIAVQLAISVPDIYQHIGDIITERDDIPSWSLHDQWDQLVLRPLSKLDGSGSQSSYILVVDALDECAHDSDIQIIVRLLAEARSLKSVHLRVFLTSRPEIPIRYGFRQIPDAEQQEFVLHSISSSIIDHDIFIFLEHSLRLIGQEWSLDPTWPGEEVIRHLVQCASGLFIWAATACRFIGEGKRFAPKRLDSILKGTSSAVTGSEKVLNEIYITILKQSISTESTDEEGQELYYMLRQILGSIAVLFSPLSAYSLSRLLCVTKKDIDQTLWDLHSVLDIPKDQTKPLLLFHPSFRDFLFNKNRCGDPNFWVDEKQAHQTLADNCIRLMETSLKQDICGLGAPDMLVTDVESSRLEYSLPPTIQYACLYWIQHLQKSNAQLYDNGQVYQLLQVHFLHWLEALGWMGKTSEGIVAILSLEGLILVTFLYNILGNLY